MDVYKTLDVKNDKLDVEIRFGVLTTQDEIDQSFALRYKIYAKYNYIQPEMYPEEREIDKYDSNDQSVYFGAMIENRLLGYIRLIRVPQKDLPITDNFSFSVPEELVNVPDTAVGEIGRLVIDKYSDSAYLPRNLVLLFLTSCIVEFSEKNSITHAYAFLKKRLLEKLDRLRLPYKKIEPFTLTYPEDGPMAPYFYNEQDPACPAYIRLGDMERFLEKTVRNKLLFSQKEKNKFTLEDNLYTKFLKTARII